MKKKIAVLSAVLFALVAAAQDGMAEGDNDRDVQVSGVVIAPYRISDPEGRQSVLFGAAGELFPDPTWSVGLEAIFGVEDRGFDDHPVYLTPGVGMYPMARRGALLEPYFRVDVPILVNAGNDFGLRGGAGFMVNFADSGLALKYSFDATYFFDTEETVLNLAHVGLTLNF